MRRLAMVAVATVLLAGLVAVPACKKQMVQVETGEIVLCTEGHVVSDTVEQREIPASEVADHGVTTSVITCDLHEKLAALHGRAEEALAAGDSEAAERALQEIVAQDPSYRNAGTRLADLRAGGTGAAGVANTSPGQSDGTGDTPGTAPGTPGDTAPGTNPGTDPGTDPGTSPGGDEPVGPIANLTGYIPDRIPGFVGQSVHSDPFVLFRDYLPEKSGAIVQMAVEVEQFKDKAHAESMLDQRVRQRFTTAGEDVSIGSLEGYVGTRPNYVRLGMIDRGILISLEFYTTSSNPAEHKDTMIAAAKAIAGQ